MNKIFSSIAIAALSALSGSAFAVIPAPEIDGSNTAIAIGLTVGALALVKEVCRKK